MIPEFRPLTSWRLHQHFSQGWPNSPSSTEVQQQDPPQAPGLHPRSSQDLSQMTTSAEAKVPMPSQRSPTSSGYEMFKDAPVAFDSSEPLEGQLNHSAPVQGVPQASPVEQCLLLLKLIRKHRGSLNQPRCCLILDNPVLRF